MESSYAVYGLHIGLAIALVWALCTDFRSRVIPNWLNAAIALAAPLYWWAAGYQLWPHVALQLGIAASVFVLFLIVFALGKMGGGDVKLLAALALWLPLQQTYWMVLLSSLLGLVVTVVFWAAHRRRGAGGPPQIPYGIAIALAGLWVLGERYFNHLA